MIYVNIYIYGSIDLSICVYIYVCMDREKGIDIENKPRDVVFRAGNSINVI